MQTLGQSFSNPANILGESRESPLFWRHTTQSEIPDGYLKILLRCIRSLYEIKKECLQGTDQVGEMRSCKMTDYITKITSSFQSIFCIVIHISRNEKVIQLSFMYIIHQMINIRTRNISS